MRGVDFLKPVSNYIEEFADKFQNCFELFGLNLNFWF